MKSYWIIGRLSEIENKSTAINDVPPCSGDKQYFSGGIEREVDGITYLCVPLSEICRVFDLRLVDFMDDQIMDRMNTIKKRKGIYPIISFE